MECIGLYVRLEVGFRGTVLSPSGCHRPVILDISAATAEFLPFDPAQAEAADLLRGLHQTLIAAPPPRPIGGWTDRLIERLPGRLGSLVAERWHPAPRPVTGLYLWGGVGRGKTHLMDWFVDALPMPGKRRVHFHHFMHEIHGAMANMPKAAGPPGGPGGARGPKHPGAVPGRVRGPRHHRCHDPLRPAAGPVRPWGDPGDHLQHPAPGPLPQRLAASALHPGHRTPGAAYAGLRAGWGDGLPVAGPHGRRGLLRGRWGWGGGGGAVGGLFRAPHRGSRPRPAELSGQRSSGPGAAYRGQRDRGSTSTPSAAGPVPRRTTSRSPRSFTPSCCPGCRC